MNWSLCIATLNRQAVLLRTLRHATMQSCPPDQIVVVDVSDNWQETAEKAKLLLIEFPDIQLDYMTHAVRSSATQRNIGVEKCRHDIVFMIDDDSFMHPTCAEEVLKIYAADTNHDVAAVGALLVSDVPPVPDEKAESVPLEQKVSGRRRSLRLANHLQKMHLWRWFSRKVLFQSSHELFMKYDEPRVQTVPKSVSHLDVEPSTFMAGSAMTVRRSVALTEPFDTSLRYYAAFEDLDAVYRYARHGVVLRANSAHLHHFEAAGGRMKRKKVVVFQLLNMLVFLKRHSGRPDDWVGRYRIMLWRRLLGEFLKDGLAGRINFPQTSGVLMVMRKWRTVWEKDVIELDEWYPAFQKEIIDDL